MAGEGESLSNTFGNVAKHVFSAAMIGMMISMALPAVAAAVPAGAATVGDVGLALVDHYGTMFSAPFTEFGTLSDIFGNTMAGNFAPGGYELGMMGTGHGGHVAATTAAVSTHGVHAACLPFDQWAAANPGPLTGIQSSASAFGVTPEQYYQNTFCHS